ncbi:unnamed protein product, partial [Ectocarpus sp. 12 AP-2014]
MSLFLLSLPLLLLSSCYTEPPSPAAPTPPGIPAVDAATVADGGSASTPPPSDDAVLLGPPRALSSSGSSGRFARAASVPWVVVEGGREARILAPFGPLPYSRDSTWRNSRRAIGSMVEPLSVACGDGSKGNTQG